MKNLKHHRAQLALQHVDMSTLPVQSLLAGREHFRKTLSEPTEVHPEQLALEFYLRNHIMAAIQRRLDPAEPLGPLAQFAIDYHQFLSRAVPRMYYYLLQICVRESRHCTPTSKATVAELHPALATWWNQYLHTNASKALHCLTTIPQKHTMGELTRFLCDAFYKGKYAGGYGGKAWGKIADVLKQYVHGEITGEMMLDTAFTLCHNNGPIFNKGMWFTQYDANAIREILDVQRAGMIPQYLYEIQVKNMPYKGQPFKSKLLAGTAEAAAAAGLGPEFTGEVEWEKFQQLGAIGGYLHYVQKPKKVLTKWEQAQLEKKAAMEAAAKEQAEKEKYYVAPDLIAKKVQRVAAAA